MIRSFPAFFLVASILLLAGCATTGPSAAPRPAAGADDPAAAEKLAKGMPAAAVRQLLGKPAEISTIVTADGAAEIWTYHREFRRSGQTATSTRSIPTFVGIGSGDAQAMGSVQVPVYSVEFYEVEETLKLLMFKGQLIEWKRAATENRSFN